MSKGNVFISGASRGIGKSIANYFAENDYMVVGTSRNDFKFENKLENLMPLKLDVTSRDNVKECFNDLKSKDLLPNILYNYQSESKIIYENANLKYAWGKLLSSIFIS